MVNDIFMIRGGLMNEKKEKNVTNFYFHALFFCIITRVKSPKKLSKYLTYVLKDELLYYDFGSIQVGVQTKKGKRTPQLS